MKRFVCWTGLSSSLAGGALLFPAVAAVLLPAERGGLTMQLFGAVAVFLGIMLMLSARDLRTRGVLVSWEGVLRLCGCAILVYHGAVEGAGVVATIGGVADGAIGVVYLVGLPRHLGVPLGDLLLDRRAP